MTEIYKTVTGLYASDMSNLTLQKKQTKKQQNGKLHIFSQLSYVGVYPIAHKTVSLVTHSEVYDVTNKCCILLKLKFQDNIGDFDRKVHG